MNNTVTVDLPQPITFNGETHTRLVFREATAGDARRADAAVNLAARAPDMSAEDVVSFVKENVKTAAALATSVNALANRIAADPLTLVHVGLAGADPLGLAMGGGLPPTAADGWPEAIQKAAGKQEPKP